jgi:hypothetical protein
MREGDRQGLRRDLAGAQNFDPSTREAVEGRFRRHVYSQLGGRQFRQVRPSTIQAWLRGLGLADSTTKVVFANLSTLLAAAVNDELIGRNPCRSLRTQSEGRAARRPAVDQADLTEGPPAGDVDQLAGLRGAEVDATLGWSGPYGVWTTISRRAPASQVDRSGQAQGISVRYRTRLNRPIGIRGR